MIAGNKNRKFEIFFISFSTSTYDESTAYIFVDFRIKRAYRANSRGASFGGAERCKAISYGINNVHQRLMKKTG